MLTADCVMGMGKEWAGKGVGELCVDSRLC